MANHNAAAAIDKRQLLARVGDRLVRRLAQETNDYAEALYGVLLERRTAWTLEDWEAALAELVASPMTVAEWLAAEAQR